MRYRVIKHDENSYEAQGKVMFVWASCHRMGSFLGPSVHIPMFENLGDAKAWIDKQRKEPEVVFEEGVGA